MGDRPVRNLPILRGAVQRDPRQIGPAQLLGDQGLLERSLVRWWAWPGAQQYTYVLITVRLSEYNAKHGEWRRWLISFACRF